MDYVQILENAKSDLDKLNVTKIQLQEKIKTIASSLNLEYDDTLTDKVLALKESLEADKKKMEDSLNVLVEKLKDFDGIQ